MTGSVTARYIILRRTGEQPLGCLACIMALDYRAASQPVPEAVEKLRIDGVLTISNRPYADTSFANTTVPLCADHVDAVLAAEYGVEVDGG